MTSLRLKEFFSYQMLILFVLGFASGLPLQLTGGTLKAWLTDQQVDMKTIGFFSLVGIPYTFKFLWAPFLDAYAIPFLTRRRGWIVLTQILLLISLLWMASIDINPMSLRWIGMLALLTAFFSASQDIVIDAYRREILSDEQLKTGNSIGIAGYYIGMLFSGAFALFLSDHFSWNHVYQLMALTMGIGILATLLAPEPSFIAQKSSLAESIVGPLKDFFKRSGAFEILAFILLYKIGDAIAGSLTIPFIKQLGFSNTDVAYTVKVFGFIALAGGSFLAASLMHRIGLYRALIAFGILQALSTGVFALLAYQGKNYPWLQVTIFFENFSAGMGTAAYATFMAGLCNKRFTATQYALLSSLMTAGRSIFASPMGYVQEHWGWANFFIFCTVLALPGLILLIWRGKTWETTISSE